MDDSTPDNAHQPNSAPGPSPDVLSLTEALYSLEIQKHRLLIQRLQASAPPQSRPLVDFVIRPRRAA
ncbi:hypothetical protein [Fuerstiella marisgermanici]|uniref:hypothetical protein n=1 Tax=Fuerstiella marisgermanici TaxID=1891926 RepID=UPI0011AB8737|nr:hypothetical protein [Fuerstiella marisgermanici]